MITIVIQYWNRPAQLANTLQSFKYSQSKDFNVLIVDNHSKEEIHLYGFPYKVDILRLDKEYHYLAAHNIGLKYAIKYNPDIIIIQHSEIYHQGDIISYAKNVTDKSYISFGCYSLGQGEQPETVNVNPRGNNFDGDSGWYNHPVFRAGAHHFCSAITTENLIKLNGFDERFCQGVAYDDDDFRERIKRLGLEIEITSDPFGFHQWHPNGWATKPELIYHNKALYEQIQNETGYKAHHILTPDL